ncbi:MAG TPA: ADOP family duplicated permease [Gammaproteobacteria bacterium]|nr:ADOP family duplicated permease [Gammaproteobacteria bacterium]
MSILRNRQLTWPAVITVAIGTGATILMFSVVNAVLLKPLPYPNAERLAVVWMDLRTRDLDDMPFSPGDFFDLRSQTTVFEDLAAAFTFRQDLSGDDEQPEQVTVAGVTTNLHALLGARVIAGRPFNSIDATPQAGDEAEPLPTIGIISHALWQRRYGGDPDIVGRTIDLQGQPLQVVGVLARDNELLFRAGSDVAPRPDVWIALRFDETTAQRDLLFMRVVGRLREGVSYAAAQAQLDTVAADIRERFPVKASANMQIRLEPMHADLVRDVRGAVLALAGAVALVLLIACANVANLLLVRVSQREREFAVRSAIGASRWRLVRQVLGESAFLALAGAAVGVALAFSGLRLLQALNPAGLPRMDALAIDAVVLSFTAMLAFTAAFLFGMVPAMRASRPMLATSLRTGTRTAGGPGGNSLTRAVAVSEVALCFVLVVASVLMLKSFVALQGADLGYAPSGILTFTAQVRGEPDERAQAMRVLRERLESLPGVQAVGAATPIPLDGSIMNMRWGVPAAAADPELFQQANMHFVLPEYFDTVRARVLAGRTYSEADNQVGARTVVIDDVLATKAFGSAAAAVGESLLFRLGDEPELFQVIGVVAHQRHQSAAADGRETLFLTHGQDNYTAPARWLVRTSADPMSLVPLVRAEVSRLDAAAAVADIVPMQALVDHAQAPTRLALMLIGVFAVIATVLAVVGLYGVLAASVRQRTVEIGVRMAFGASPLRIFRQTVGQGVALGLLGIAIGLAAALALSRVIAGMLVDVSPTDASTYALAAVVFLAVVALASWVPAARAARLQPLLALRDE